MTCTHAFRIFPALLVLPLLFIFLGQSNSCRTSRASNVTNDNRTIPAGVWGGQHIRLEATASGAEIEFDCAHGTIEQAIALGRDGRFDVGGRYFVQHAGPVRRGEENGRSARYTGRVEGDTMTLNVTLTDNSDQAGPFTLTRGSRGNVFKCR
jgi:hypothetical protein